MLLLEIYFGEHPHLFSVKDQLKQLVVLEFRLSNIFEGKNEDSMPFGVYAYHSSEEFLEPLFILFCISRLLGWLVLMDAYFDNLRDLKM
jgi:hypothetical protein